MNSTLALALSGGLLALSSTAHAAEFVDNGSFSSQGTDWTASGVSFNGAVATFDSKNDNLSQTFSGLVSGQTYQFSFDYTRTSGSGPALSFELLDSNGTSKLLQSNTSNNDAAYHFSNSFNAISTSATVTFKGFNGKTATLDNVSLTGPVAAVPEPESYAMMLAGLGAIGIMARRRQQKS